jgi:hypothetical protein
MVFVSGGVYCEEFFERRGREGDAEGAEKKYKIKPKINAD